MTKKRFEVFKTDIVIGINDNGESIGNVYAVCDLLNELYEKKKKLTKVIEEDEKLIQSTYDELTKLRCIKKNLGKIKAQWDWIMEAIQYD